MGPRAKSLYWQFRCAAVPYVHTRHLQFFSHCCKRLMVFWDWTWRGISLSYLVYNILHTEQWLYARARKRWSAAPLHMKFLKSLSQNFVFCLVAADPLVQASKTKPKRSFDVCDCLNPRCFSRCSTVANQFWVGRGAHPWSRLWNPRDW